jgi:protein-S-isoprenylcysteine O-methyltransferase Ste14
MRDTRRPSAGVVFFAWSGGALFLLSLVYFLYCYLVRFGDPILERQLFPVSVGESGNASASMAKRDGQLAAVVNVMLFTVFALHHSVAARPFIKMRLGRIVPEVLERSLYTWTASLLFVGVCALWQFVPGELYHLTGLSALPGYLVQLAGIVLAIRSSARLDVLDLAGVRPVLVASGGHAPAPVPLVTRGLYGLVRHPVYFAWLLMVFGSPRMTMTRLIFALVSSGYLAIAIPIEERSLIHRFGAEYRAYQRQVRWRLIPGLY